MRWMAAERRVKVSRARTIWMHTTSRESVTRAGARSGRGCFCARFHGCRVAECLLPDLAFGGRADIECQSHRKPLCHLCVMGRRLSRERARRPSRDRNVPSD